MAAEKSPRIPKDPPPPGEKTAADTQHKKPKDSPQPAPVAGAGPVAVHVESGAVKVVVAPPAPARLGIGACTNSINGLPHTTTFVYCVCQRAVRSRRRPGLGGGRSGAGHPRRQQRPPGRGGHSSFIPGGDLRGADPHQASVPPRPPVRQPRGARGRHQAGGPLVPFRPHRILVRGRHCAGLLLSEGGASPLRAGGRGRSVEGAPWRAFPPRRRSRCGV